MSKEGKKKKLFTKNAARAVVFVCLTAAIVLGFCLAFGFTDAERTNKVMEQFYALEDNSVDVIYFGPSVTQRAFVTPLAYHDYGVAECSIASGTQPFVLTRYLIEETLKTQDPKLFIVELKNTCKGSERMSDVALRRIVDNMKCSQTRIDAINAAVDYSQGANESIDMSKNSYYFPILKYHSRWNPSLAPHYSNNIYYFKGYTLDAGVCFGIEPIKARPYDSSYKVPIPAENEPVLNDFLDYCDTLDQDVLFVISPYEETEEGMGKFNYTTSIIESRGYEVLNFLPPEKRAEVGIEDDTCYYNNEHLNYYGSLKYTKYLSDYIKANYGIPDRSGDGRHESWNEDYEELQRVIKKETERVS